MILTAESRSARSKDCPSATFSTIIRTWTTFGLNPGFRSRAGGCLHPLHDRTTWDKQKTLLKISYINLLTPNDDCIGRTAPLTSKCCILYIYSTNIGTEYFKHVIYSPSFPLQNAVCFINLTYLVPVLFTFYIQGVLKLKKNNSGAKRLNKWNTSLPAEYKTYLK